MVETLSFLTDRIIATNSHVIEGKKMKVTYDMSEYDGEFLSPSL